MTADELKAIQSSLKERYRNDLEGALTTLTAEGNFGQEVRCNVDTGKRVVEAGLHSATGGSRMQVCSGEMLLEALVACAGVTLAAVSTAMGIVVREGVIRAEGDLDFRGTLGVSKETPVGFTAIRLRFELDTNAEQEQIANLIRLTERYCVALLALRSTSYLSLNH